MTLVVTSEATAQHHTLSGEDEGWFSKALNFIGLGDDDEPEVAVAGLNTPSKFLNDTTLGGLKDNASKIGNMALAAPLLGVETAIDGAKKVWNNLDGSDMMGMGLGAFGGVLAYRLSGGENGWMYMVSAVVGGLLGQQMMGGDSMLRNFLGSNGGDDSMSRGSTGGLAESTINWGAMDKAVRSGAMDHIDNSNFAKGVTLALQPKKEEPEPAAAPPPAGPAP